MDRKKVLIFSDLGAGCMTIAMLMLYANGNLALWHLYLAEAITGALDAFQVPANTASTSLLVPKEHYSRASGMQSLGSSAANILAPAFAGLILKSFSLTTIFWVDILTFIIAISILLTVFIPSPEKSEAGLSVSNKWQDELFFGFRYIFSRKGLSGLLIIYILINFLASLTYFAVLNPLILARTGGDEGVLAIVQSFLGIGGVIGGILVSVWGGPRKKVIGYLAGTISSFFLGDLLFAVGQSTLVWAAAAFFSTLTIPYIVGMFEAIWQLKVEPDIQGKVFSVKNMLQTAVMPIGFLLGGILADQVFTPAFMSIEHMPVFAQWLTPIVGSGPGAGMGAMFLFTWFCGSLLGVIGFFIPSIRNVENDLPDAVQLSVQTGSLVLNS